MAVYIHSKLTVLKQMSRELSWLTEVVSSWAGAGTVQIETRYLAFVSSEEARTRSICEGGHALFIGILGA